MKKALFIIDPQNDFCEPTGSLFVSGADEDTKRLIKWFKSNINDIDGVFVTLDSHVVNDISHPHFWEGQVESFTIITKQEVLDGKYTPKQFKDTVIEYLETLEKTSNFKHCIWPEHCIFGTHGFCIQKDLAELIREWELEKNEICNKISKGSHPLTEHFGAFQAQVPLLESEDTHFNTTLFNALSTYDEIYLTGQAKSHCVANTILQMIAHDEAIVRKVVFLQNTSSNVPGFESIADDIYLLAKEKGMRFENV